MNSLQKKFTIAIIIEILIIALVLGGVGSLMINRIVEKSAMQLLELTCQEQGVPLNNLLLEMQQAVDIMAGFTLDELESMDRFINDVDYQKSFEESLESKYLDIGTSIDGVIAFYLRWNYQLPLTYDGFFYSHIKGEESMVKYPVTDLNAYDKEDFHSVGWYHVPVDNGEPTWLAPYSNVNYQFQIISYVVPMYADGQLLGVVGMDIDYEKVVAKISEIKIFEDGYAYMVDEENHIIYHPKLPMGAERPTQKANELEAEISLRNGCTLIALAHREHINAEGDFFTRFLGFATLFFLIAGSINTILMVRHITRPLKELTDAAVKIADGNFDVEINCQSKDEVGTLARSFQKTASSLKEYVGYINGLAFKDSLTGIRNNMAYQEYVSTLKAKMQSGEAQFAVAIFDANGLKTFNDTYGHEFGNQLIIATSKYICNVFKHSPVFRIGGDEFIAILQNEDYHNREALYKTFYENLSKVTISVNNQDMPISIALGIAEYDKDTDFLYDNVFAKADSAMYEKKREMKVV